MADTSVSTVSSHILSEILSEMELKPLRSKFVCLPQVNVSSIDGQPGTNRKIPKRSAIAMAVDDTELVEFTGFEALSYDTAATLTPTGKVQGVKASVLSLMRRMPGATHAQVVEALKSQNPDSIPMLAAIAEEVIIAHYKRAEYELLQLFSGLSGSKGTTNTALGIATLVDAQTDVLDNNPEHHILACVVTEKGVGDLRKEILAGSGAGIATVFASGLANEWLSALGDAAPSISPSLQAAGMPIFAGDVALFATANAGVDSVGSVFCIGKGETAGPGSLRGFAEFCEGFALEMGVEYDLGSDSAKAIGRYNWAVGEHTDEHGTKLIYKKT